MAMITAIPSTDTTAKRGRSGSIRGSNPVLTQTPSATGSRMILATRAIPSPTGTGTCSPLSSQVSHGVSAMAARVETVVKRTERARSPRAKKTITGEAVPPERRGRGPSRRGARGQSEELADSPSQHGHQGERQGYPQRPQRGVTRAARKLAGVRGVPMPNITNPRSGTIAGLSPLGVRRGEASNPPGDPRALREVGGAIRQRRLSGG
jgi:hypothetical protein